MAASVRIEDEAFACPRFVMLGRLQLDDPAAATELASAVGLGTMAKLWRQCTAMDAYELPAAMVAVYVDPEFVVAAMLGERTDNGMIRIRGTRGRIEWLAKKRKASRKGGAATRARSRAKKGPSGPPVASRNGGPNGGPPAPAPAPAPALSPPTPSQAEAEGRPPDPEPPPPPEPDRSTRRAGAAHQRLLDARRQVATQLGIRDGSRLSPIPGAHYLESCGLLDAARRLSDEELDHVLAVRTREAAEERSLEPLNPVRCWHPRAIAHALAQSAAAEKAAPAPRPRFRA